MRFSNMRLQCNDREMQSAQSGCTHIIRSKGQILAEFYSKSSLLEWLSARNLSVKGLLNGDYQDLPIDGSFEEEF